MVDQRSPNPNRFFSAKEKAQIVSAIREAEKETSGEIRIHLEDKSKKDIYQRAQEVFRKIGMDKTEQRNGVLIYIATGDKQFAILGDKGINDVVPDNFWEDVVKEMQLQFQQDKFQEGICSGVSRIGEKLKSYFPHRSDDVNELSDEISIDE